MRRVIELLRVSTAGQSTPDKASIPTQRSINRQTALAYGLTIVRSIELADVSGAQVLLAPEIQEMLKLMNDPEIHGVVVREFSRLMRPENFSDYAMLQAFVDTDTWLYLPEGPINFASTDGRLLGTMRAVMGGIERTELVKKMWRIKEEKRRAGGFAQSNLCLPFAVDYQGGWSYTADSARVAEAFRCVLSGNTSYTAIGKLVGINPYNLRNILRNSIYTGWRVIDKRRDPSPKAKKAGKDGRQADRPKIKRTPEEIIRVQVIKEPLVSESDFNQVQRILDLKKANHWRTQDGIVHRFIYNGFLRCACGRLVYTKYRRDDYYICSARCGVHYMRRERLDSDLDLLFTRRLTSSAFLKKVIAQLKQKRSSGVNVAQLRAQIDSLENKRKRILDGYFEGVITGTDRDLRMASVGREKVIVSGLLAKERPQTTLDVETLAKVFSVFAGFDLLERDDKRRILNTIAPSIVVANYEIKGLWLAFEGGYEGNRTAAVYNANEGRLWLPIAA